MRFRNTLVAFASVLVGKTMVACRLRRAPEGWRRTVGVLLRSESTRFGLSTFGLRLPAAAGGDNVQRLAADELQRYLARQPDAYFALEWLDVITRRRRRSTVDVALFQFSEDGDLQGLTLHVAEGTESPAVNDQQRRRIHEAVIATYNSTRDLPEVRRPPALKKAVEVSCARESEAASAAAMKAYAERLLTACCLSFESVDVSDPARRFRPPEFHLRRTLGFGFLSVVMRLAPTTPSVDVWMSAHHVGLDGVPLQELVTGLEQAWGRSDPVLFPAPDRDRPFMDARACSVPGERKVEEMLTFVDFSPVIALRERLNARHAAEVGAPITFGTVIAWLFSLEPEFSDLRMASTVDVASSGGYERDVDVVPLRPADFAVAGDPWNGIVPFATEFNRLIALSRSRTSPLRRNMQTAGLLPPHIHSDAVYSNPASLDDTFGSLCITIIREASIFVAPMTDIGLGHGFFAIGSTRLPSADGGRVTAVSIKGEAGTVSRNYAILQRIVARSRAMQIDAG